VEADLAAVYGNSTAGRSYGYLLKTQEQGLNWSSATSDLIFMNGDNSVEFNASDYDPRDLESPTGGIVDGETEVEEGNQLSSVDIFLYDTRCFPEEEEQTPSQPLQHQKESEPEKTTKVLPLQNSNYPSPQSAPSIFFTHVAELQRNIFFEDLNSVRQPHFSTT